MVKDWRTRWGVGDFPFYYVQIAPFSYGNKLAFQTIDNSAFIREAQLQCLDLIPNSGMAVTLDIGDPNTIHPPKKKEVADRLLFIALNKTYGFSSVDYTSPIYDSQEIKDSVIILSFKNAELGFYTKDQLSDFMISGSDKIFYPAEAKIPARVATGQQRPVHQRRKQAMDASRGGSSCLQEPWSSRLLFQQPEHPDHT